MDINDFIKQIDNSALESAFGGGTNAKKINQIWSEFVSQMIKNPNLWLTAVQEGQQKQLEIFTQLQNEQQTITPPPGDRRFSAEEWTTNPLFSMLMQSYLLNSNILRGLTAKVDMPEKDKKILQFAVNQYIDAVSPTNFPTTNPKVMEEAVKTGGESLAQGMKTFIEDWQNGSMVKNTDVSAFAIGDNIAVSKGKVVLQNPLMQLIEYTPQTKQVYSTPLLIVPPCINKFYILDLTREKSMIAHLTAAGHRVFLISWVNADYDIEDTGWDDYLRDGVMAAIEAVQNITKAQKINTMGFCIGGTLLVGALAALAADGEHPAKTTTLLAAMLDFSDSGEIGLFVDEKSVAEREQQFAGGGLMDGSDLAKGFATLRPNDLIWPYVIDNYYQGKPPPAFDLLFWNADSTNLPGRMFAEYLRMTYLENQISRGTAVMCNEDIKPATIKTAGYAVACEKDHIVPWQTAYLSACLLNGKPRFVLAASGHIAGIINPPEKHKGWHLIGNAEAATAEAWAKTAVKKEGSWWQDWFSFLTRHGGKKVAAPKRAGNVRYPPLEDAPGSYVSLPRPAVKGKFIPGAHDNAPQSE